MPTPADFPAKGKVLAKTDDAVTFAPAGSNYELSLLIPGGYSGPMNVPVDGLIRMRGRKLLTVPSGGNFISPIFGRPNTVQGRVKYADDKLVVLHASCPIVVELPTSDNALDLNNGPVTVGCMVNITICAGASFELLGQPAMK